MSATEQVYRKLLTKNITDTSNNNNDANNGSTGKLSKADIDLLLDWKNFKKQRAYIHKIVSEFTHDNLDDNIECISNHLIKLCHSYNLNVYSDHNDKITIIINAVLTECDKKLDQLENNRILAFPIMLPFIEIFTDYIMKIILLKVVSLKVKLLMTTIIVKNILCLTINSYDPFYCNVNKASYKSVIEHLMDRNDMRPEDEHYDMWITLKYLFFVYIMFNRPMWFYNSPILQWETCWNEIFFWECLNFVDEILTHKILRFRKEHENYQSSVLSLQKIKNLFTFTTVKYPSVKWYFVLSSFHYESYLNSEYDGPIFLFLAQAFTCTNIFDDILLLKSSNDINTTQKFRNNLINLNKPSGTIKPSSDEENLCDKIFWENYEQYPDIISQIVSYGFVVVSNMISNLLCCILFLSVNLDESEMFSMEMIFLLLKYITMVNNSQKGLLNDNIIQPNYLVYYIVELVKSFIGGYLNRKIKYHMFNECLIILKNVFLYQVQTHTQRYNVNYVMLWTLLFSLLNYVCAKTLFVSNVVADDNHEAIDIVSNTIDIFDLFIVCGDDLLESHNCYDRLYYEIIRNQETLLELHNHLTELISSLMLSSSVEIVCCNLVKSLNNFKSIIKHFMPIISETGTTKKLGCVDESELLDLIGNNYGNLNLQVSAKIHTPSNTTPTIEFTPEQIEIIIQNTKQYITNIQDIIENIEMEKN